MNKKKLIQNFILLLIFNGLLLLTISHLNLLFRSKEYEGAQDKFAKWNPSHADIVFVGNSHQFCSIDADLLYEEYGLDTFMLATSAQTVPMSYYAAMEAIELKKPDTIIFEISYVANDFMTVEGMDHCFFDGFPRSKARKLALNDLIPKEEQAYYLLPIGLFHSRWKELSQVDYEDFPVTDRGTYRMDHVTVNGRIPLVKNTELEAMPERMEEYYRRLIQLCREAGVELILYVAPFNGQFLNDENSEINLLRRERIYNYAGEIAKKEGVEFHNLFYELDEIGLEDATDWADTQHLNRIGQEKMTRYMVEKGYIR